MTVAKRKKSIFREYAEIILLAVALALFVRTFGKLYKIAAK